jgi:Zn-dependent M16 (insulinase) family peptidase
MWRILTGTTDAIRQQRRDEILGASQKDFAALADALEVLAEKGHVVVLGGETAIKAANDQRPGLMEVSKVM